MARLDKAEIVEAIRRWVAEHGEVPGSRKFIANHDVPPSAFRGTLWPNWSAAVADAGFESQKPTDRIEPEVLLAAYAALTRELGHVPTWSELTYKKKQDPTFPSTSVIENRLGRTAERLASLREWCGTRPEWADVTAVLPPPVVESEPADEPGRADGWVYLLCDDRRRYKIGMSSSVQRRWAEIEAATAGDVDHIHRIRTDDPAGIEAYWHRRFIDKRIDGEWFALTRADVTAFRRRARFM